MKGCYRLFSYMEQIFVKHSMRLVPTLIKFSPQCRATSPNWMRDIYASYMLHSYGRDQTDRTANRTGRISKRTKFVIDNCFLYILLKIEVFRVQITF